MAGITLIFTAFERNFVISLGAEVQKEDDDSTPHKAIQVVESSAHISQPVGFTMNEDEEWEDDEDDAHTRVSHSRPPHW